MKPVPLRGGHEDGQVRVVQLSTQAASLGPGVAGCRALRLHGWGRQGPVDP